MSDDKLVEHMASLIAAGLDRIEQLTAERDQWIAHTKNAVWADSEELKLAEAERDRFRKVLERVASLMHDEYNPYSIEGMVGDAARIALKEAT